MRELDRLREFDEENFDEDLLDPLDDRVLDSDLPVSIVFRRISELIAASRREASRLCSDVMSFTRKRRLRRSLTFFV